MRQLMGKLAVLLLLCLMRSELLAQDKAQARVSAAQELVARVKPENNSYRHKQTEVSWGGNGPAMNHADCSAFLNALLLHTGSLAQADFKKHLGSDRPFARHYHDAIIHQRGFIEVTKIQEIRAGDIIAIRYPPGSDNTGHVMLVLKAPVKRPASEPLIRGTVQHEVEIADSTRSGHGTTDTRRQENGKYHEGLGTGVFRIYTSADGVMIGHAWSNYPSSQYHSSSSRHLAVGRIAPGKD